jgi:hypothetical protein
MNRRHESAAATSVAFLAAGGGERNDRPQPCFSNHSASDNLSNSALAENQRDTWRVELSRCGKDRSQPRFAGPYLTKKLARLRPGAFFQ